MAIEIALWVIWLLALACSLIVAYRRAPASKLPTVAGAGVLFGVVALVCAASGSSLLDWLSRDWFGGAVEPLITALSPLIGLLAVLRLWPPKNVPATRAERWLPYGIAALAACWTISDVQATAFWLWRVDAPTMTTALARTAPITDLSLVWRAESVLPAYLELWPTGPQAERARGLHEQLLWHAIAYPPANNASQIEYSASGETAPFKSVMNYLGAFPTGPHVGEVLARLTDGDEAALEKRLADGKSRGINALVEARVFDILSARRTVRAHQRYQQLYSGGRFAGQSQAAIEDLRHDTLAWERAARSSDADAIQRFMDDFPGHANTVDAQRRLDGLPLDELLASKLIEVEFGGCGITGVCGRMRRLAPYPLVVAVTAGTLFTASVSSVQSMTTTSPARVELNDSDWVDVRIDAACADMWRAVPDNNGAVGLSYVSNNQDTWLRRLEPVLAAKSLRYPVAQALVWIVRNNPSREQLRKHLYGGGVTPSGEVVDAGGGSVIDDAAIDEALTLLNRAGYPIGSRRAQLK